MTQVSLQIQPPAEPTLTAEQLQRITGKRRAVQQIAWLDEHRWRYELAGDGTLLVGALYAHLRLAGLELAAAGVSSHAEGFDLGNVR